MPRTSVDLSESELAFLEERHLGTLTTLRADGTPHVVAIAFAFDAEDGCVRVISSDATQKVRNVEHSRYAVVSQVDGRRWLTLEGPATVRRERDAVNQAVEGFEARYRPTSDNPRRVAIEIDVARVLGRA